MPTSSKKHMTPGAIDLENMMSTAMAAATTNDVTTDDYDDVTEVGDAAAIRRQLDGLETMYSEVLKLLGLRKFGRGAGHGGHGGTGPRYCGSRLNLRAVFGHRSQCGKIPKLGSIY